MLKLEQYLTCNDYFKNISKILFLHKMIAYSEMYLEMKFEIFSSVKSIVIIKKIKISFTFSTLN